MPFIYHGKPTIVLKANEEIQVEPYKFVLVSKFVHHRPSMAKVHDNFSHIRFCSDYTVGLIDATHILIHLEHEDDYARLFLKPTW